MEDRICKKNNSFKLSNIITSQWLFFIILSIAMTGLNAIFAVDFSERVDRFMQVKIGTQFPSAQVLVIKNGVPIHQRAYGTADIENNNVSTNGTCYRIASVSKAFTALAIVILAERGLIDYEAPITDYLKNFPSYGNSIKIRHLLHHLSGLKDYDYKIPSAWTHQITDYDVVKILSNESETDFPPGSKFCYSNSGYAVLAVIVAEVSKVSFSEFLHREIFSPLGMNDTVAHEDGISTIFNRAYGHTLCDNGQFAKTDQNQVSAVLGDGGIYSSITDMFYWDQALYNSSIISDAARDKIFTSGQLNDGTSTNYGFGWKIKPLHNHNCVSHLGSSIGFRSTYLRFPADNFSVFVIANETNAPAYEMASCIAEMYFENKTH